METMSRPCRLLLAAATAMLFLAAGCRSYRIGAVSHPEIRTIAIGSFANATDEPALAVILRQKLAQHVIHDGSLRLAGPDKADVLLLGTIDSYTTQRGAAAKVRDDDPDGQSTYRTTVYDVQIDITYSLVLGGNGGQPVLKDRAAVGSASFAALPDDDITRQSGFQQALTDAARTMIAAITEAW